MPDEKEQNAGTQGSELSPDRSFTFNSVIDDDDDDITGIVIRHKTTNRYKLGRFEFKKFTMRLTSERDFEEFVAMVKQLPPIERNQFDILNERAIASASRPLISEESTVVRGAMTADQILTAKDREAIAKAQGGPGTLASPTNGSSGLAGIFKPKT